MRAQVEVVLEWMSDITFNQNSRNRVSVFVTTYEVALVGEEADLVTLAANNNGEDTLGILLAAKNEIGRKEILPW